MGAPRLSRWPAATSTLFSGAPLQACGIPMPSLEADRRQEGPTATAIRVWRGLWHSQSPQEAANGGIPAASSSSNKDPSLSVRSRRLAGPQVQRPPAPTELQGAPCSWTTAALNSWTVASPSHGHWRNGNCRQGDGADIPVPPENPCARQELDTRVLSPTMRRLP